MSFLRTTVMIGLCIALTQGLALADEGGIPHDGGNPPSTTGWTLTPTYDTSTNTATVSLTIDNLADLLAYNGTVTKQWTNIDLGGGAVLNDLTLGLDGDPQVNLNFSVVAGTADTTFNFNSALLTFATINPAEGRASAGITLSDYGGDDGVTATGLYAGGKFYDSWYNGSSNFAYLISGPVGTPDGGGTAIGGPDAYLGGGLYAPMGSVSSMQSGFSFKLSAYDGAATTSTYRVRAVVPEPASFAALATGLMTLVGVGIRRRRA